MIGINSGGCAFGHIRGATGLNICNASMGNESITSETQCESKRSSEPILFKRQGVSYKDAYMQQVDFRQQVCKEQALMMPRSKDGFTCSSIHRVGRIIDENMPYLQQLLRDSLTHSVEVAPVDTGVCKNTMQHSLRDSLTHSVEVAPVDAGVCKNTIGPSSIAVVTAYDRNNEGYALQMLEHQTSALQGFSSFSAFSQVLSDLSVKRHPTWAKVPAMYQVINDKLVAGEDSHWVVWIDSDVFFYDGDGNAPELIPRLINEHGNDPNIHYIFTTDPTPDISAINNGFFAMRVSETSLNFLDLAWRQSQFSNKGEGACTNYCLDEQDAMTVVLTNANPEIRAAAKIVSPKTGVNQIFRFPTVESGDNYKYDDPESEFQGTAPSIVQIGSGMPEHRRRIVEYFQKTCENSVCSRTKIISALACCSRSKVINFSSYNSSFCEQDDTHENNTNSSEYKNKSDENKTNSSSYVRKGG